MMPRVSPVFALLFALVLSAPAAAQNNRDRNRDRDYDRDQDCADDQSDRQALGAKAGFHRRSSAMNANIASCRIHGASRRSIPFHTPKLHAGAKARMEIPPERR